MSTAREKPEIFQHLILVLYAQTCSIKISFKRYVNMLNFLLMVDVKTKMDARNISR